MTTALDRRHLLRLLALASVGVAAAPALAACGGASDDPVQESSGLGLVAAKVDRSPGDAAAVPAVAGAMAGLAGRLYGALASGDTNLALSPYSIAVALGLVLNGAGGQTASQMESVLGLGDGLDLAAFNGGLNALTQEIEGLAGPAQRSDGSSAEIVLATANQLFGDRSVDWAPEFLDVLAREYGAGMRVVDYVNATEEARKLINDWTAEQTHDKIPQIIPEGVLDALTRLVLVNAIYLKAPWEVPFMEGSTTPGDFHRLDGSVVSADLMHGVAQGGLVHGPDWKGGRILYAGGTLAMTVVVPDADRFSAVEGVLASDGVAALLAEPGPGEVLLTLPKWTFRSTSPLTTALQGFGMVDAFDQGRADLDAMTPDPNDFYLTAVLHQAFIAVDEEGTEAAAATAAVAGATSMPIRDELVVDRPFLFVIHDVAHGTPLFLGRVTDPTVS